MSPTVRSLALVAVVGLASIAALRQRSVAIEDIGSPALPGSGEPSVAADADGRVYMSWLEPTPDTGHALRFAVHDGSTWSAPRTIRQGRDFFVNWADFPSVEVVGPKHLVAHWLQRTGRTTYAYGVRLSQSRDGGASWSSAVIPHRDSGQTEHGFAAL